MALAPLLGGCATSDSGPSLGNLGRNFADDWTGARAFDQASANWDRGDLKSIQTAGRALNKRIAGGSQESLNIAEAWVTARLNDAMVSQASEQATDAGPDRDEARKDSNRAYRAALAFLPDDARKWRSFNPQTLNAMGYFLADQGHSHADFELAEKLTKVSLDLSPERNSGERYVRAEGPGDSHAWALFRLGRTAEALQQQASVIATLGDDGGPNSPPSAEVIYHWGAICRVAGREDSARDAFKYALTQNPSVELREILEANLSGSLV